MRATARRKQRAIAAFIHPAAGDLDGIEDRPQDAIRPNAAEVVVAVVAHPIAQLSRTTEHRRQVFVAITKPDIEKLRLGDRITDAETRVIGLGRELRERRGKPFAFDVRRAKRARYAV